MIVAPQAGWIYHSRLALRVCSRAVDSVLWCWLMCWSALLRLAGRPHRPHMPPTDCQLLPSSHTWCNTLLPVCLPGHGEDPMSLSAQSHYDDGLLDSQGQRAALWRTRQGSKTCLEIMLRKSTKYVIRMTLDHHPCLHHIHDSRHGMTQTSGKIRQVVSGCQSAMVSLLNL